VDGGVPLAPVWRPLQLRRVALRADGSRPVPLERFSTPELRQVRGRQAAALGANQPVDGQPAGRHAWILGPGT
jgi:hypothetical protein